MNTIQIIREALETHQIEPDSRVMHQDPPGYTQKCAGCHWIGWDHVLHVAKTIDAALGPPDDLDDAIEVVLEEHAVLDLTGRCSCPFDGDVDELRAHHRNVIVEAVNAALRRH